MKRKSKTLITFIGAFIIVVIGLGGQLFLSLWIEPNVFNKEVVKVKSGSYGLPENSTLKAEDLYIAKVPVNDIPDDAFLSVEPLIGKTTAVKLTNGMIVTEALVDINKIKPQAGEGVYALPKEAIYAINGSLRANDVVNIRLVAIPNHLNEEGLQPIDGIFLKDIRVAFARADDNNDVRDSTEGINNDRKTSTAKVAYPEVLLSDAQGEELTNKLQEGYKLWIIRTS